VAVTFQTPASTAVVETNSPQCVANKPTGTVEGDCLIAVHAADFDGDLASMTAPTGWGLLGSRAGTTSRECDIKVWRKFATASEPTTYQFDDSINSEACLAIFRVTGHDPAVTPTVTFNAGAASTSHVALGLTGAVDDLLLTIHTADLNDVTGRSYTAVTSGMTERVDINSTYVLLGVFSRTLTAAGATGNKTATCSNSHRFVCASLIIPAPTFSTITGVAVVSLGSASVSSVGTPTTPGVAAVSLGGLTVATSGMVEPAGPVAAFSTSFEGGNFTEFNSCQWTGRNDDCQTYNGTSDYSATVVAVDSRPHVARFEVRDGDVPPFGGGERSEIAGPGPNGGADLITTPGTEFWFAFDMKIDAAFPNPAGWGGLLWQLHANAVGSSPPLALNIDSSGNLAIANNDSSGYLWSDLGSAVKGSWRRYVIHAKFSDDEAVGFREMWIDGVRVEPLTMCKTMIPGDTYNYLKLGHYRDDTSTGTAIAFFDNLRITSTSAATVSGTAAVTPGGVSVTAIGLRSTPGTASVVLGALGVSATGTRTVNGTADVSLGSLSVTAIGTVTAEVVSGAASVPLAGPSVAAVGRRTTPGTVTVALGGLSVISTGTVIAEVVGGSASVDLGGPAVTAVGQRTTSGTSVLSLGALVVTAAVGSQTVTGTALASLGPVSVTAVGTVVAETVTGTAHVAIAGLTITGTGTRAVAGIAAVTLPGPTVTATGMTTPEIITGTVIVMLGGLAVAVVVDGQSVSDGGLSAGVPVRVSDLLVGSLTKGSAPSAGAPLEVVVLRAGEPTRVVELASG
jgi:hypothetical protein